MCFFIIIIKFVYNIIIVYNNNNYIITKFSIARIIILYLPKLIINFIIETSGWAIIKFNLANALGIKAIAFWISGSN